MGSMHLACADPGDVARFQLIWDANPESDLAGYKVYSADNPSMNSYSFEEEVPAPDTYWIIPQDFTRGHFIALTAFDTSGNESQFSVSVQFNADTQAPGAPSGTPRIEPVPAGMTIRTVDGIERLFRSEDTTAPAAPGSNPKNLRVR